MARGDADFADAADMADDHDEGLNRKEGKENGNFPLPRRAAGLVVIPVVPMDRDRTE